MFEERCDERNIRLILAYDGTEIHGYQKQENAFTVQEALEVALSRVCNEPITVYGISRTDTGVHAKYQVVTFFTRGTIPVRNLKKALIAHLPPYIVVTHAEEVPLDWRARKANYGKKYVYTLYNAEIEDPLHSRYHVHVKKPLDIGLMKRAALKFIGKHDFSTFAGTNTTPQNPLKEIFFCALVYGEKPKLFTMANSREEAKRGAHNLYKGYIEIHIGGDGFLYHMVRNIVGFLIDVGLGRKNPDDVPQLLAAKNRSLIGKTAPAKGLCLEYIYFDKDELTEEIRAYNLLNEKN